MTDPRLSPSPHLLSSMVSRIAASWHDLGPDTVHRRLTGTMLHADLTGSTSLGEELLAAGREGNEVLIGRINAAFDPIISTCARHRGDVLKFGGDAVLVFFSGVGHERRALQSASEMQLGLAAEGQRRAGVALRVTVGVHSGDFDFWMVGRNHKDLVVAGANGTRVVEVEEQAGPGQVVASSETLHRLAAGGQPSVVFDLDTEPDQSGAIDTELLARFVPPRVLAELESLEVTAGEHRLVTSGFVLCQGVEEMLAAGSTVELANQIERLFRTVLQVQADYGVSFLHSDIARGGFKILLAAGAPVGLGEESEAMLLAVSDLVSCPIELTLRGSVHRGPLFAGLLGTDIRRTYSLMGDDVNLASHLLGQAEHRQVVTTRSTLESTGFTPTHRPLPPFLVKGRRQPVDGVVIEAFGTVASSSLGTAPLELVGRAHEVRRMRAAWTSATSGRPGLLRIEGEVGMGKTRLIQELAASVDDDVAIAFHAADRFQVSTPFASAQSIVRQALGIDLEADPGQAGQRLIERASGLEPSARSLLPLLGPIIDVDVPSTADAATVGPEFRTAKAAEVTAGLLRARTTATCLVLDDSQWVDAASDIFIGHLSNQAVDDPWLFVTTGSATSTTTNTSDTGTITGGSGADERRMVINGLEGEELQQLVISAAAPETLTTNQLQSICERSGGNPLFAVQLAGLPSSSDLPRSIEALLNARLDLLPPRSRTILKVASVFGREMPTAALQSFLATELSVDADLDLQIVGDFLVAVDDRLVFANDLLRQVAYTSLPYEVRRRWHRSMGALLESDLAVGADISLSALALHFALGGDRLKSWEYGRRAGDDAAARYANREAVDAYRTALADSAYIRHVPAAERGAVAVALGDVLERLGHYDEADAAFATARRLAGDPLTRAEATQRRSWIRIQQGNGRAAKSMQTRLLAELGDNTPATRRLQRTVQLDRLGYLTRSGTRQEYDELEAAVLESSQLDDDRQSMARAYQYRLGHLSNPPSPDQAASMVSVAADVFRDTGELAAYASTMNNYGFYCHVRSDWARAVTAYEEAADAFRRVGDDVRLAVVSNNRGELMSDRGDYEGALRSFRDPERVWTAADYRIGLGVLAGNQGRLLLRMGQVDEALTAHDTGIAILEALNAEAHRAEVMLRKAEALLVAGECDAARDLMQSVRGIADRDAESMAVWLHLGEAVACHLDDDGDGARRHTSLALAAVHGDYGELHARATAAVLGMTVGAGEADSDRLAELSTTLDIVNLPLLIRAATVARPAR